LRVKLSIWYAVETGYAELSTSCKIASVLCSPATGQAQRPTHGLVALPPCSLGGSLLSHYVDRIAPGVLTERMMYGWSVSWIALQPTVIVDMFGLRGLGGLVYTAAGIGALLGPPLAGLLINTIGGYRWVIARAGVRAHVVPGAPAARAASGREQGRCRTDFFRVRDRC
jgi:hypothetical protein